MNVNSATQYPIPITPIRLLLISPFDPLPGDGVSLIRYPWLADALAERGVEVCYLSSDFFHFSKAYRTQTASPLSWELQLLHTPPYRQNIGLGRLWNHHRFAIALKKWLNNQNRKFDLVLSAFPPVASNLRLHSWTQRQGIPLVLDIQDLWPEAFLARLTPKTLFRAALTSTIHQRNRLFSQASALVTVSQDYQDYFPSAPGQARAVFPLGWDPNEAKEEKGPLLISKEKGDCVVFFLGGATHLPLLPELLRLREQLPKNIKLVFAGRHPLIRKGISDPGRGLYFFHEADTLIKQQLLSEADIGLLIADPALLTRFPNKTYSYLGAGLKVLSNIRGGEMETLIQQQELGYSFSDTEELPQLISRLSRETNDQERQRISHWARNIFDKKQVYARYADWLLEQI